jgi:hypothetical protein
MKTFKMNLSSTSISVHVRKQEEERSCGSHGTVSAFLEHGLKFIPHSHQNQNRKEGKYTNSQQSS